MTRKLRWGVLGAARIAVNKVVPAMQRGRFSQVVALASRDAAKGERAARALGIARVHDSYEALLADPDVEAVYNPLPNHLHVPWTVRALEAGKHVLCEKPLGLDVAQVQEVMRARDRTGLRVQEAFMVRTHPQWLGVRELIRSGRIGTLRAVASFYSYFNDDPGNVRNVPEFGGGGLYDIGCYAIVSGRFLFEADPTRVLSLIDRDPVFRTDRLSSGLADFGSGRHLGFTVSTQLVPYQRVQALGTKGRIEIQIPFNAPLGEGTRIFIDSGASLGDASARTIELAPCDQYQLQGEAFSRAVRGVAPLAYGVDDAVMNMRILDALYRAERTGLWETV
jgi:predicted dehydrogenase